MALIGEGRVFTPGRLQKSPADFEAYSLQFQNVAVTPMTDHVFMKINLVTLDSGKIKAFQEAWRLLASLRLSNPSLYLAALRLSYANGRAHAEDRILDVVIAAEALFLSTETSGLQQELSYRASLRAAFWSEDINDLPSKLDVFAIVKAAYSLRSKIAHGRSASDTKLKGENIKAEDLIKKTISIVQLGLWKALRQAIMEPDHKFKPDWDRLILG